VDLKPEAASPHLLEYVVEIDKLTFVGRVNLEDE